jgi:hypothetical protein
MGDLKLRDIFPKTVEKLTKLSIYVNGVWEFTELPSVASQSNGSQSFYQINQIFGLVSENNTNPSKISSRGARGDYVALSRTGLMQVINRNEYKKLFAKPVIYPNKKLTTSLKLQDPMYLTKIVKGSPTVYSNTTTGPQSVKPKDMTMVTAGSTGCNCSK